jgi:hypothetical protein
LPSQLTMFGRRADQHRHLSDQWAVRRWWWSVARGGFQLLLARVIAKIRR